MRPSILTLVFLLPTVDLSADAVGYSGRHEVDATSGTLTFHHVHDWDSPKLDGLFSDLAHHDRFFSPENDFAFVELREGEKILFRSASPALTHLWISPDSQTFVGFSYVKLRNPYQLAVWRRDGSLVHREHISEEVAKLSADQRREFATRFPKAEEFLAARYFAHGGDTYLDYAILGVPNEIGDAAWDYLYRFNVRHPYSDDFAESVTNVVQWFDLKRPEMNITRNGTTITLALRSRTGKRMAIPLKR